MKKSSLGNVRHRPGELTQVLYCQRGIDLVKVDAKMDHLHVLSLPPQYRIAKVANFVKSKKAILAHRKFVTKQTECNHFVRYLTSLGTLIRASS